jgi:putative membrane protein
MIRTDRAFSDAVAAAVREAERGSAGELIVVVAARSGSYLDVALGAGAGLAMIALLVGLFAPVTFPPLSVAIEVALAFLAGTWLTHRTAPLLRILAPPARRHTQAVRAASERFLAEAVHGTRERTGLLVYLSLLEERAVLLPDLGLDGRIPRALWGEVRWGAGGDPARVRTTEDFLRGIAEIGSLLRSRVPAGDADVNESPDAPRIVPRTGAGCALSSRAWCV